MTQPRFLADEDLSRHIVDAVMRAAPEIDFQTVQDLGLAGTSDPDLLEFASGSGRILVSHDVHTMTCAATERLRRDEGIAGLLLIPQERASREVIDDLVLIALTSAAEEWQDRIQFLPL